MPELLEIECVYTCRAHPLLVHSALHVYCLSVCVCVCHHAPRRGFNRLHRFMPFHSCDRRLFFSTTTTGTNALEQPIDLGLSLICFAHFGGEEAAAAQLAEGGCERKPSPRS